MKNKLIITAFGLLIIGFGSMLSITGAKREAINTIRKETAKVTQQTTETTQEVKKIENVYNHDDVQAKSALLAFAKAYYTFDSQASYEQRFANISELVQLSDEQKKALFDNGRDDTGGSRIDNLGLVSQYDNATGYTSDIKQNTIETLMTVVVKTSSSRQQATTQVLVLHAWYDVKLKKLVSIKINAVQ
ncbi:hypothetical protein LNP18_05960 [Leuconostoc citreum]|nr:hypothetical protein [Leuconostoc citreum]MCK8605646.1 hypothetical protein [Leuconostoc citreum]